MAEIISTPSVDAAIGAEGYCIVRADLDLIDEFGGHPAGEARLAFAVETPGDECAVVEDCQGE